MVDTKERLVKMIQDSVGGCARYWAEIIADHLIENGVVEVVKVAEILSNAFGNDYPCNFYGIDEWLPYLCEYANTCDCSSVKCWEQLIKHYGERKKE